MTLEDLIGHEVPIFLLAPLPPITEQNGVRAEVIIRTVESAGLWVESKSMIQQYRSAGDELRELLRPLAFIPFCHIRGILVSEFVDDDQVEETLMNGP